MHSLHNMREVNEYRTIHVMLAHFSLRTAGRFFMKSDILAFYYILSNRFGFHLNRLYLATLHEHLYAFMHIYRYSSVHRREKSFEQKVCWKITCILCWIYILRMTDLLAQTITWKLSYPTCDFFNFIETVLLLFITLLSSTRITQRVASVCEHQVRLVSDDRLRATSLMQSTVPVEEQRKTSKWFYEHIC
jgi:hypothetical protein